VGVGWAIFGIIFVFYLSYSSHSGSVVLTEDNKTYLEATQAQIRNELLFEGLQRLENLSEELLRKRVISESFAHSRLDGFKPLFYEQHGTPGPEEQEALERVGAEISRRLAKQTKQAAGPDFSCQGNDRILSRQRSSIILHTQGPAYAFAVTKRQSFTGTHDEQAGSDGRRGSRRLSSHPMGFVLSSTQPRSRASLVSSLVVRSSGSVAESHHQL
jgi:hypothetical protein